MNIIINIVKRDIIYFIYLILFIFLPIEVFSQEIRITTSAANQSYPDIWDNYIVYLDDRDSNINIYLYDLSTSSEVRIVNNPGHLNYSYPRIYQGKIVYEDYRTGNWDIYLYDINLLTEYRITTDPDFQYSPSIFGDYVLWTDERNDEPCEPEGDPDGLNTDLYLYNWSNSTEAMFAASGAYHGIYMWNDLVAWTDDSGDGCDVNCTEGLAVCIHLPSGVYRDLSFPYFPYETKIVANKYVTNVMDVYKSNILYYYFGGIFYTTNLGLYFFNVETLSDTLVSNSAYACGSIYGRNVIFKRTSSIVTVHDLNTSSETDLPIGPVLTCPVIYEDKIVYTANRYGNKDIFMYVLKDCDALNCDDNNPCTDDTCNPVDGCLHTDNTGPCDDSMFCNGTDTCSNGTCGIHAGRDCNDGLYCNGVEACNEALDRCDAGIAINCDDDNVCTTDSCNEIKDRCEYANNSNNCDDGVFCNGGDKCLAGSCAVHLGNNCDDGLYCSGVETCNEDQNLCEPGVAINCDDNNACTDDSCSEDADRCEYINNINPCDDGVFCNGADICKDGICEEHYGMNCDDNDVCTVDSCNESQKLCEHIIDSENCPPQAVATGIGSGGGGGCLMSARADLKNFYASAALYTIPFLLIIYLRKRTKQRPS